MTPRKRTVDRADPTPRKPRAKKPPRVTERQYDILCALNDGAADLVPGPSQARREQGRPRRIPRGTARRTVEYLDGRAYVALRHRRMVKTEPYGDGERWLRVVRVVGEVRVR